MIEKFTFDVQLRKERKKIILVKGENELRSHVVLKLLAYILYYDPRLQVEVSAGLHYKPDLMIAGNGTHPELWIDCGYVAMEKVKSLAKKLRTTRLVFVKETRRELETFKTLVTKKSDFSDRLEFLGFDAGFVSGIAEDLERTNDVVLYEVMENVIGLALNDSVFESSLYR